jgi:hypothetical protein
MQAIFKDRKLIIATKHHKEMVIAPILTEALGVDCSVPDNFDTDLLGTFSGEIERKSDPISTVRQKCLMAMEQNNCDLGLASEGSFGAHPTVYFATANEELLIFIDKKNNLEVIVREISTATNFNAKEIQNTRDLLDFADKAYFPSHSLILRKSKDENLDIIKGISDKESLLKAYSYLFEKYGTVYVETDMRAMYNPMRMAVIEGAAKKLVEKINSLCPSCQTPGFDITDFKEGLECSLCYMPTQSIKSLIYSCQHCKYTKEEMYPKNKTSEDPMYCDFCNP